MGYLSVSTGIQNHLGMLVDPEGMAGAAGTELGLCVLVPCFRLQVVAEIQWGVLGLVVVEDLELMWVVRPICHHD